MDLSERYEQVIGDLPGYVRENKALFQEAGEWIDEFGSVNATKLRLRRRLKGLKAERKELKAEPGYSPSPGREADIRGLKNRLRHKEPASDFQGLYDALRAACREEQADPAKLLLVVFKRIDSFIKKDPPGLSILKESLEPGNEADEISSGHELAADAVSWHKDFQLLVVRAWDRMTSLAGVALDYFSMTTLKQLGDEPFRTYTLKELLTELTKKGKTSSRLIQRSLRLLEQQGLVHRPLGRKKGWMITPRGKAVLRASD